MLHDISYLLRLPIVREAVGAVDIPDTWRAGLSDHFAEVMVPPDCQPTLSKNCWKTNVYMCMVAASKYME
jgi:hypothetical protein